MEKKKRNRKVNDRTSLAIEKLQEKNSIFVRGSENPLGHKATVYFVCNSHPNLGEQQIRVDSLMNSLYCCKGCRGVHLSAINSGSNSSAWKGGVTRINEYIRKSLSDWIIKNMKLYNYKCYLTDSKKDLQVHHLEGFDTIVSKFASHLNIDINSSISSLSLDDLDLLKENVVKYHMTNNIGVVLNKEVHSAFHRIYGLGGNTPEQFDDFCLLYKKEKLKESNVFETHNINTFKKFGKSKYIGVIRRKNGMWSSSINDNKRQKHIGTFLTEYRAAQAYNEKAIELKGGSARLNDLSGLSDYWVYEDSYYPLKKSRTSSIYIGVTYTSGGWRYEITENRQKLYRGTARSELEAAYLYNQKKLELLGSKSILNFLSDDEQKLIESSLGIHKIAI